MARLPAYYGVLVERADGTISSETLAELAGVNAAKVRKDLSYLGSYGTRGVGYDVEFLLHEIARELGLTQDWPVAIIGIGNLGQALARYPGFVARGYRVVATFDSDPAKVGRIVDGHEIHPIEDAPRIIREREVAIGVITTPTEAAQSAADVFVDAGVRAILSFAVGTLQVPDGVQMRRVDLASELQILSFYQLRNGLLEERVG